MKDGYNYEAFSFAVKPAGLEHWVRNGPKPGEATPGFRLETVTGTSVSLYEFRGRPVVLEFGSCTNPTDVAAILADLAAGTSVIPRQTTRAPGLASARVARLRPRRTGPVQARRGGCSRWLAGGRCPGS